VIKCENALGYKTPKGEIFDEKPKLKKYHGTINRTTRTGQPRRNCGERKAWKGPTSQEYDSHEINSCYFYKTGNYRTARQ
jgi:hypothetical protein